MEVASSNIPSYVRVGRWICGLLLATLFVLQLLSLFLVPIFDSWGDESWLMLEFREQMLTGVLRHPYAFGSTIHISNGVVFGSSWVTATLYGLSQLIFASADIISVGRVVTILIAIAALALFIVFARRGFNPEAILLALAALISSRVFFLVSHSARYDIITAAAVFGIYLLAILTGWSSAKSTRLLGLIIGATILITSHTILILIPLGICSLYKVIKGQGFARALLFVAYVAIVPLICIAVYVAISPRLSLFGSGESTGFKSNLQQIPLMHPFGGRAIIATLSQKIGVLVNYAPALGLLLLSLSVVSIYQAVRRSPTAPRPARAEAWLVILGYFLFEGSQFYYLSYVLFVAAWLVADRSTYIIAEVSVKIRIVAQLICLVILYFGICDALSARGIGQRLTQGSEHANGAMKNFLDSASHGERIPVLFANQSVHEAIKWKSVAPVTTHFQDFPAGHPSWDSLLLSQHIRYVEILASGPTWWYSPQVVTLRSYLNSNGHVVLATPQYLLEAGRDYFGRLTPPADTLLLYQLSAADSAAK